MGLVPLREEILESLPLLFLPPCDGTAKSCCDNVTQQDLLQECGSRGKNQRLIPIDVYENINTSLLINVL